MKYEDFLSRRMIESHKNGEKYNSTYHSRGNRISPNTVKVF